MWILSLRPAPGSTRERSNEHFPTPPTGGWEGEVVKVSTALTNIITSAGTDATSWLVDVGPVIILAVGMVLMIWIATAVVDLVKRARG